MLIIRLNEKTSLLRCLCPQTVTLRIFQPLSPAVPASPRDTVVGGLRAAKEGIWAAADVERAQTAAEGKAWVREGMR